MPFKLILLFLGTVLAFWLSAISGGGASLILIPILNLLLPTSLVPFSLTIGTATSSASRIAVFRKHINWRIFGWFVPFSLPAVLLGAYLIKFVNPLYLQLVVALFLLANLRELFASKKVLKKEEKPSSNFVLAAVGFASGFVSGVTGAIGLLFNRFYLNSGLNKEEIIATRAANEIFLHLIKLIIYILLGLYSKSAIYLGLLIALASVVSSFSVKYILPYISEIQFKRIGFGAMIIAGFSLLFTTSSKILKQGNLQTAMEENGEKSISWHESNFVLEYDYDDGFEIERPIKFDELPDTLKPKFHELSSQYDKVLLEKVFRYNKPNAYEFACYKQQEVTEFEFD